MFNRYLSLVLLPALLPAIWAGELRVGVTGAQVTAGDLAAVMPEWDSLEPSTEVAPAPLPGVNRRVSRGQLMAWAADHGLRLEPEQAPEQLLLAREMRRLSSEELLKIIRRSVSRRYGRAIEDVRFFSEDFVEPLVPAGKLKFSAVGAFSLNRTNSVRLKWIEPDGRGGGTNVRGRVEIHGTYLKVGENIAPGEEIHAEQLEAIRGPLPSLGKTYVTRVEQAAGMASRFALKAGDAIERGRLAPAIIVHRGDLLEVRLNSGAVRLRAPARAEQHGVLGASLRCRNLQSGRTVQATVRSARVAEVEIP